MNPQFLPPQQFGGPPQSFPPNSSSPQSGVAFQNVPLGPSKPGQLPSGFRPTGVPPSHIPPSSTPGGTPYLGNPSSLGSTTQPQSGQFPSNTGPPLPSGGGRLPIPSNQLPPSQDQRNSSAPQTNPFHPPPALGQNLAASNLQNGPSQFSNSSQQFQNGPLAGPPILGQENKPTTGPPQNLAQNQLPGAAPVSYPNGPPPRLGSNPPSHVAQPGANSQNQFGPPPGPNQPPNQYNQPPLQGPPAGQNFYSKQPPVAGGPPRPGQPIQPPLGQNQLGSRPNQIPGQQQTVNQFPGQPPLQGQPPLLGQSPLPGQQPLQGQPQLPGQQPLQGQPPLPGQQPVQGQPPLLGQQPLQGQPPLPGQQPLQGQPPLPGQQHVQGQPLLPGQQPLQGHPPLPGQPPVPGQLQMSSQPPVFAQPPMPGHPPLPGRDPSAQFSNQYASGPHAPGGPMQYNGTSPLVNQLQSMNLSGPRQYPNGGMKDPGHPENSPHMPPPISQQGYVNGQQVRGPQGPGYPPLPGQGAAPGLPGSYPQPNYQQQQQQQQQNRRLDPDQMPSPIQVTQDDQQNRSGVFVTNQKGLVPPLVTTKFVVQDQGNSSPRYIRSTMYNVPISQDIIKQTAVPFSLVVSPMARTVDEEYPPPIVNFGELGPIRCIRCKAYMSPYMQFIDSGRRFQCLFCRVTTDVPAEYFQHLDHTGQRMDRYERPELVLGTYEFVATADYCRNNTLPKPPAVIFVIDVSYNNVKSGLVNLLCSQMKDIIQNLPVDQGQEKSNMRVGFITYNSSVHFYNIKGTLAAPQMMVVGDVQEMFMPLLDGFLCTPEESEAVIDALMQQIPAMFGDTRETETVLLPAIQAGLEAIKASECNGKLLVFHSTLPTAEAPGKLKNRDDRKLLGTEKEKTVLTPQTQAYNQLGQDCVAVGCSVDLFIFNNAYIDLATIGQVARLTGGEIFKYTYFQADIDGERLINDVITDISRPIAFDAIMRVRTSTGVRATDFYGHFYMSNTTDMELASMDCDKAIAVEIKYDDKLSEEEGVYIQVALLYTSCSGQRRLRIINLALKTCSQMADLYRSCDLDTIINYISKQAVYKLLDHNPKAVKDSIVNRAAQILASYRKNCASPSSAGQLILPECMKLLPLYVNCLLKSDALSGGSDMTIDDRSFVMQAVLTMDIPTSVNYFYPRLLPLHELDTSKEPGSLPSPIRCTIEKMSEQGVYVLENGIHMFLWFGLGVNPDFIQKVFGAPSAIQVDLERVGLPELDNPLSLAVRSIIESIRIQRHRCMRLTIVRQREKLEPVFKHFLVEDRGNDGSPSYVDFLCHMHKEIRTLLS